MNDPIDRQTAIDAVSDCGICIQKIVDLPSAQPKTDWNEMIVICDCCGHAIRVKRVVKNDK